MALLSWLLHGGIRVRAHRSDASDAATDESLSAAPLPRKTLIGYGLPGLPLAALGLPLYVYVPTFYVESLGLGLAAVGAVLLLARLLDVLTDPLVGYISDYWRLRPGRRKGMMLLGAPLLLIGVEFLFRPWEGAGAVYLFIWASLAYLGWTLIAIPYSAWGAELSADYHQRTRVTAAREAFVITGTALAIVLPALHSDTGDHAVSLAQLAMLLWLAVPAALIIAVMLAPEPRLHRQPIAWREGFRLLFKNSPLRALLLAYLLNGIANGLPATLFLLFVTNVLKAPEWSGPLLGIYFFAGILALPLWLKLARSLGKHRAWSLSMLLACAVFVWAPFLGAGDVGWFAAICLLSGLSLGADLALPASIQADVVDLDNAFGGGGRTGFFFGLWSMITKLALALAVGLAFPLLALAGFDATADNPPRALLALALLYGGLPVAIKLIAVGLVWRFPLDQVEQARLQRLAPVEAAAASASRYDSSDTGT